MNDTEINNAFFASLAALGSLVVLDGVASTIVVPVMAGGQLFPMIEQMVWLWM